MVTQHLTARSLRSLKNLKSLRLKLKLNLQLLKLVVKGGGPKGKTSTAKVKQLWQYESRTLAFSPLVVTNSLAVGSQFWGN